jgi:hypothetical protein
MWEYVNDCFVYCGKDIWIRKSQQLNDSVLNAGDFSGLHVVGASA